MTLSSETPAPVSEWLDSFGAEEFSNTSSNEWYGFDEDDARQKVYTQCYRTIRGGALDARDISYFEGAKQLYPWLNALAQQPGETRLRTLRTVLSGRFDATNPEQMKPYEATA